MQTYLTNSYLLINPQLKNLHIMNSNAFCPISTHTINENVARSNAGITVLFLITFLVTGSILPIIILLVDFLLRGLELSKYSLIARISKFLVSVLKFEKHFVNSGPKLFAARIGILFSIAIAISVLLAAIGLSFVLAFVFSVCAFLEFACNYCVACKIYPFVYKLIYSNKVDELGV